MTPAADIARSTGPVRVRLVGPLRVYVDRRRVADPPAGRADSLLALLAVDAGHLIPIDRIIDDLWPDGPPAKAKENVASLVSRLRRLNRRACLRFGLGHQYDELRSTEEGHVHSATAHYLNDVRSRRWPIKLLILKKLMLAERVGFEPTCRLPDKTLSRRPRYDHFGTSPFFTSLRGAPLHSPPRCAFGPPLRGGSLRPHLSLPWLAAYFVRRPAKKFCITARQSSSRTPPSASIRWFSDGCSCARIADSIAPALGSGVP